MVPLEVNILSGQPLYVGWSMFEHCYANNDNIRNFYLKDLVNFPGYYNKLVTKMKQQATSFKLQLLLFPLQHRGLIFIFLRVKSDMNKLGKNDQVWIKTNWFP